ncbi:MAG: hypothetical protein CUN49_11340 [Candidatus Thermofonsia Clade 1 bacterium]|jgi:hypothetical protein|uniref:Uncharacterized protein n=1 Tax=Candidatus Thermofonsia Clade 1 bacterium TaxID=2364210 RepID=A0A2M8PCL9_9CHLR|nr:MAG: hypothetical protein CUN49_11340 [Candidatus Thermofonsia Clade 1 bacterium]RMF50635.1 MAG: CHAT domain-containing protein [Chloroflexota bacterium]
MSLEQLTMEEFRRLVQIVSAMPAWQRIDNRQFNLIMAGLEHFIKCVNLDLDTQVYVGSLIRALRDYGSDDGQPVLAKLVRYLVPMTSGEDRQFLETLLGERHRQQGRILSGDNVLLFLSANPGHDLHLDREMRLVEEAIRSARCRGHFRLEKQVDLQLNDLQSHLLRFNPSIVHFSGHGDAQGSIVVMNDRRSYSVPIDALCDLFRILKGSVRLVVLNSCFSQPLAERLAEVVECVIGTSAAIGDESAIEFAKAFYRGLANGESVHIAFALGVNQLDLKHYADRDKLHLFTRSGVDAKQIVFC